MGIDKKINVCHLISGDLWAGAEVQMYTLVTALKTLPELNISAIVLNEGKLVDKLKETGIEVTVIDENKNNFFLIVNLIKKELQGRDMDILHTHRYKENVLGALAKKSGKTKYLVQTVHGADEKLEGFKKVKSLIYTRINNYYTKKYYDKILPVSNNIHKLLNRYFNSKRLVTMHNSVDVNKLKVQKEPAIIKKEFQIGVNDPVIGSAGRMVPIKGYEVFLEMAKIIIRVKPNVKFLLVGDGPLKQELEEKAIKMGLDGIVIFPGFRDDIIDIINCLDIFVISSYHEGIPMVLLEAMALKKAIVSTDVGGVSEIIEKDISGLLVNSGDALALAEACIKALDDDKIRNNLETETAKRIDEEFSIGIQEKRVLNLYQELVSSP